MKISFSLTKVKLFKIHFTFNRLSKFVNNSACLRPHEKVHLQTAGTRFHNYMILSYNLVSVGLCLVLYRKIESEDKQLAKTLKLKVLPIE